MPFIPTEEEIDQLIAGCGKKTAAFLQVLKDTGARGCEASKLEWIDVDQEFCTIRINNPVKGSLARIVKVTPKTIAMTDSMPKTTDFIFNPIVHTSATTFAKNKKPACTETSESKVKADSLSHLPPLEGNNGIPSNKRYPPR